MRLDFPRKEAPVRLKSGTAANFRLTHVGLKGQTFPPGVWGGALCPPRGVVGGTCHASPPPCASPLPLSRALPTAPGRISPLTMVQSVSGLPSAFTVHVAGGVSLEIHAQGAGTPTLTQHQGEQSKHLQKPVWSPRFLPQIGQHRGLQCSEKRPRRWGLFV